MKNNAGDAPGNDLDARTNAEQELHVLPPSRHVLSLEHVPPGPGQDPRTGPRPHGQTQPNASPPPVPHTWNPPEMANLGGTGRMLPSARLLIRHCSRGSHSRSLLPPTQIALLPPTFRQTAQAQPLPQLWKTAHTSLGYPDSSYLISRAKIFPSNSATSRESAMASLSMSPEKPSRSSILQHR